ncbi:MAG: NADH:flavin oxidoreductase [Thermoguttaceae bacterium]|nr:NADH:flavin oxidoreductase [Thermoguttaceae bacterium]
MTEFKKIATFKNSQEFRSYLQTIGADFDLIDEPRSGSESAFSKPYEYVSKITGKKRTFFNRWTVLPMEGWDCLPNGAPSDLARRRWLRFAESGASIFFGCEAVAVMPSAKANARQMAISRETVGDIAKLREETVARARNLFGSDRVPYMGLQLTHSGRFVKKPDDKTLDSHTAYEHPYLDKKFHCDSSNVLKDEEVEEIIAYFIQAGKLAEEAGFDFVDVKCAHGYLGFEFLTAYDRQGKYGGSFENRTRFIREIVEGIRKVAPGLDIGSRLGLGDFMPFEKGLDGVGKPAEWEGGRYPYAFNGDGTGLGVDPELKELLQLVDMLSSLGVSMICSTFGSPYYCPHTQRPAAFAVSDGYLPPEDPLLGVARQIRTVRALKERRPSSFLIGSGYTYLQEFLPLVGEWVLESGGADSIGVGRSALSYPSMAADYMSGKTLNKKAICRTFGDCTNAPRAGLVSGCYPLDDFYKAREEATALKEIKRINSSK